MTVFPQTKISTMRGVRTWLDSSNEATVARTGTSVTAWTSQTLAWNKARQASGAAQPQWGTTTQNGLPVISFNGSQYLTFDNNDVFDAPFSIYFVGQASGAIGAVQGFMGRQTGSDSGSFVCRRETSGGVFNTFLFVTGSVSSQVAVVSNNNANIHTIYYTDGGAINYRLNGNAFSAGTARSGYNNAMTTAAGIGAANGSGPTNLLTGWIGEIIIFGTLLATDEDTYVLRYLANKWGLAT